jgi:hypothetical protein
MKIKPVIPLKPNFGVKSSVRTSQNTNVTEEINRDLIHLDQQS